LFAKSGGRNCDSSIVQGRNLLLIHGKVIGGNANGDTVLAGGGTDSVTLGTGVGDALFGGTGANQSLSVAGANATLTDGTGANQTLMATGGHSSFNCKRLLLSKKDAMSEQIRRWGIIGGLVS
jgi:Ca2+-binding RTX toxin-like protein